MNAFRTLIIAALGFTALPTFALSDNGQAQLHQLQTRWAEINYQTPEKQREEAFAKLVTQADAALASEPKAPELLIWRGIILSTEAGAKGGLGALGLVKEAKASLEQALAIDPQALAGSAYTSLGSLYYQVPGWPIGFGDDEKAEKMLTQALAINPDGLDPNYFYGDFLQRQKRYEEARAALEKALAAKDRPGRELADNGRRAEATALLQQVESKLQ
ncbi:tetratricopeptide repeat protein [Pseudomonas oleovorans]|uniref:Tetratricopeptide repeat protein n=1 Tax=Ectopseudomonas oleovorans TaxID=301 RepID=A0AB35L0I5_ECTOL|nr:tetratricopeptide repeat protein [Pseudomonas oleovorans]MCR1826358.1 tetratricopeptide repeat protein [Pseudomonas oleovorans]MDG9977292.1 tetratricopeptide repeat protein [Pseudomonas oleovorans]MDH0567529.1 tetratricopeptide repeat protein [Pseudomonas oleovorans]